MKSDAVTIRPWRAGDRDLLLAAATGLSPDTLHRRFRSGTPVLPPSYLRLLEQHWPACWDAVVAVRTDASGEHVLLGWAEFGRSSSAPGYADVAVCLTDAEQGHGLGTALLVAVFERARAAGVAVLHADIATSNPRARYVWRAATGHREATFALAG